MNAVILHQYRQIISQIPLQFENPKMNQIIECYEQTVQQLTQTLNDNRTYQHRFQSYEVFEEIKREEDEIQQLLEEVKARAIVLRQLRQKETTFITQHPHYPNIRTQELYPSGQQPSETQHWLSCQINHTIKITLSVHSLHHFLQEWGNLENQLLFQSFQLHLHHIDKRDSSRSMRYHPSKNMYHVSHMVDNKLIRSDRSMTLSVQHVLRTANIELYRQLLNRQPITVVGESSYGAVLGIAEIDICDKAAGGQFKNMPICLKFSRKCQQDNSFIQQSPIFYALCELSLSISAVPPQLEQLTRNCQSQFKQKEGSRSPSPSRIISTGSKQREKSPKVKRQLVSKMVCPGAAIQLTIYEGWQHKHQVQDVNLSVSKELIYKSLVNIKERRIELVKAGDNFYFKLFAVKQQGRKAGSIVFSFNSKEYQLHVVPHTLFQTMPLALYQQSSKLQRKDTQLFFENGLVDLGQGNVVYARENNRIQKNLAKLQIQCRLLGTLFVRSILSQCEVHCNPPFKILQAVKKQDGFMLTYRCQLDFTQPKERVLVVYLNSKMSIINEMHVYSCLVLPRKVAQQTLYREIYVRQGEEFARLSLKMIASQSYIYEIQASEADKVRVVNGCNFSYTNGGNQYLVLQIVSKDLPLLSDLILRDNKKRASFMRLCIKAQF